MSDKDRDKNAEYKSPPFYTEYPPSCSTGSQEGGPYTKRKDPPSYTRGVLILRHLRYRPHLLRHTAMARTQCGGNAKPNRKVTWKEQLLLAMYF